MNKADPIAAVVEGPVTSVVAGSVLQHHPNVVIIVDELAATKLAPADYFRDAWAAEPNRQRTAQH